MTKPFPFQLEGVELIDEFNGRCLLADPMGLGKTLQALLWIKKHADVRPVIVVCPAYLKDHWAREAAHHTKLRCEILWGMKPELPRIRTKRVIIVVNYTILRPWLPFLRSLEPQLVVIDECFPQGTLVTTDKGEISIDEIVNNEIKCSVASKNIVTGEVEFKRISRYFKIASTKKLVTIHHQSGELTCTEDHKIWTVNRGYVEASQLTETDLLQTVWEQNKQTVLLNQMQSNIRGAEISADTKEASDGSDLRILQNKIQETTEVNNQILWQVLFSNVANATARNKGKNVHGRGEEENISVGKSLETNRSRSQTQISHIRENEEKQPNEQRGLHQKNACCQRSKRNTAYLEGKTQGEWATDEAAESTEKSPRNGMDYRNFNSNETQIPISVQLQSRPRKCEIHDTNRNRWPWTQCKIKEREGSQKTDPLGISRVESIEVHQCANRQFCQNSRRDNQFVYCIEVEDNNNFFANGILVSNCQALKNPKTAQSRNVKRLCRDVPHVIAISGTPLTNRPAELFPVLNLLDPENYNSFSLFASEYSQLVRTPWGTKYEGARHLKKLHRELKSRLLIRREKHAVLKDLPEKVRQVIELPIENEWEYEQAVSHFVQWVEKAHPDKARKAQRNEQITKLGYLIRLTAKLKLKAVIEWIDGFLEDTDEKLLVACVHKSVVKRLAEHYGRQALGVTGETLSRKRQGVFDQFNTDKRIRLLFGNIDAAGTGWSCKATSHIAVVEFPWTPGQLTQFEDRIHGIGRGAGGTAFINCLVASNTIEEFLCRTLQKKAKILEGVLDGKKVKESLDIYDLLTKELRRES